MEKLTRVGFITGCGKGIGYATTSKLLSMNSDLYLIGINRSINDDIKNLQDEYPNKFSFHCWDVTDFDELDVIIKKKEKLDYSGLDFLICNAGIRSRVNIEECDLDLYRKLFEVNTISQINLAKKFSEINLKLKKSLNILMISSIVGSRGFNALSSYAVSKSALEGFIKSSAIEWAKYNIRVNGLAPGFVESSYAENFKKNKNSLYEWTLDQIPMKRWGTCEEIADIIQFLVSNINSYMTGSIVYCDGGWTAK